MARIDRGSLAMNPEGVSTALRERLAALLPASDAGVREDLARATVMHIRHTLDGCWTLLVQRAEDRLTPVAATTFRLAVAGAMSPDLPLGRMAQLVTPAVLLSLPDVDPEMLVDALLRHADPHQHEQVLDALTDRRPGCRALHDFCLAWSRRSLIAELGLVPDLTHSDRIAMQQELLSEALEHVPAETEPQTLGEALAAAANRRATAILAERANVQIEIAETAIGLRDPKLLLALCWKAGCNQAETIAVQLQLGHIPPDHVRPLGSIAGARPEAVSMPWRIGILQEI